MVNFYIVILIILSKIAPVRTWRGKIRHEYKYLRECKYNLEIKKQKQVADYLHQSYIGKKLQDFPLKPKKTNLVGKKIIWQFWGQGIDENTPAVVKTCFNSVKNHCGDYEVIVLTNDTVSDYLDLPDFVYEKFNSFEYAHFSDLIRISLLCVYGGVWIDARLYLTDKIPQKLLKQDFFMFQLYNKPVDYKYWHKHCASVFNWDAGFKVRVMNGFMIAKPNNPVMQTLRKILYNYWQNENKFIHYMLFQIIFNEIIDNHKNCEIVDLVKPHQIHKYINQPYSDDLWNEVKNNCFIHILEYNQNYKKGSIFEHILNNK